MAVEPTNVNESAAALQEPGPEALLTDADLEGSPAKSEEAQGAQTSWYAHVHDSHGPMHDKSESLSVRIGESLSIVL